VLGRAQIGEFEAAFYMHDTALGSGAIMARPRRRQDLVGLVRQAPGDPEILKGFVLKLQLEGVIQAGQGFRMLGVFDHVWGRLARGLHQQVRKAGFGSADRSGLFPPPAFLENAALGSVLAGPVPYRSANAPLADPAAFSASGAGGPAATRRRAGIVEADVIDFAGSAVSFFPVPVP